MFENSEPTSRGNDKLRYRAGMYSCWKEFKVIGEHDSRFQFVIHHNWCVCSFFFFSFLGLNHGICENETSSNRGNAILSISKKYQKTEEGVQQRRPTESEGMFDNLQPVSSNRFQIFCSHLGIVMNNSPKYFPPATT